MSKLGPLDCKRGSLPYSTTTVGQWLRRSQYENIKSHAI